MHIHDKIKSISVCINIISIIPLANKRIFSSPIFLALMSKHLCVYNEKMD